jgi:hypothetical protein
MNAKSTNVVSINAKGDKALADNAHKADRIAILEAIDTASDLLGASLLEGLRMTARFGLTSKAEVAEGWTRCNNPDVYAANFNRGYKAMQIVGEKLALEVIDKAERAGTTARNGGGYVRALAALKAICDEAKSAGVKELTGRKATEAVKAAVAFAAKPTAKKSATRAPQGPTTATLAKAALAMGNGHAEMAAFLKTASHAAQQLPVPEGRETAHRDALEALADAAEAFSVFAR